VPKINVPEGVNPSENHKSEGIRTGMGVFIPEKQLIDWPEIIYVESCSFSDVPLCDVMNPEDADVPGDD